MTPLEDAWEALIQRIDDSAAGEGWGARDAVDALRASIEAAVVWQYLERQPGFSDRIKRGQAELEAGQAKRMR